MSNVSPTNKAYWRKRFEILEQSSNAYAKQAIRKIDPAFAEAERKIDAEITAWYQRFADNNEITMQEARKLLNSKELAELKWDVETYIQYGEKNALDGLWMKQLENASAKFHISRLEALKLRTQQAAEVAFGNELDEVDSLARKVLTEGYYHTAFELQKGVGVGWDIGTIDNRKLEKLLTTPWTTDGKTFSDRIWTSKQQLIGEVHNSLTRTCILGKAPDDAIKTISKKFGVSKSQAGRLVMTEQAYFHSVSQKEAFADLGVEQFEIVATLDSHTSEICQDMDGEHFDMKDYEPGVTAPPFHPWCRSVTCPYFDDDFGSVGERAARDEESGKTYYVPANVKYPEWKKAFVDGGSKKDFTPASLGAIIKAADIANEHLRTLATSLENLGVEHNPVVRHQTPLNESEIIDVLGGGDKTSGSCASVGLAYIGQKLGLNVLDFRGGESQSFFSMYLNLKEITKFPNVSAIFETARSTITVGNKLLKKVEKGKQYYLCVGRHAAMVRKTDEGVLQYLELQTNGRNGWIDFNGNPRFTLSSRFGCRNGYGVNEEGFMIDYEELEGSEEFELLLGYINTAVDSQKKGVGGHAK